MLYRRKFIALVALSAALLAMYAVAWGCVLVSVDPLQLFGNGVFYSEKFHWNMRLQAKGIIDNVNFDSAILGTSMLENSSSLEASQMLGGKFVNVSISGSNFYERSFILDYLFRNKEIKTIIFSFDWFAYKREFSHVSNAESRWTNLYDDNILNDFFVYCDKRYFTKCIDILRERKALSVVGAEFFDRPCAWFARKDTAALFGGLANWVANNDKDGVGNFLYKDLPEALSRLTSSPLDVGHDKNRERETLDFINDYFLNFVRDNPSVKFYVIFPPYYRYMFAELRQVHAEDFGLHQRVIAHMVAAATQYSNLEVYGFEDMEFLDDIANYKDTGHYAEWVNSFMTKSIAEKQHMLNPSNLDAYLEKCEALAASFDIRKLYNDALELARRQTDAP